MTESGITTADAFAPDYGRDGARVVGWARAIVLITLMLIVVMTTTSSMAAEYDPAKCPEAQATVAALVAVGNQSTPPAIENGDPRGAIACTVCCQPTHSFAAPLAAPEPSVSDYPPYRLRPGAGLLASRSYELLRPPRL